MDKSTKVAVLLCPNAFDGPRYLSESISHMQGLDECDVESTLVSVCAYEKVRGESQGMGETTVQVGV